MVVGKYLVMYTTQRDVQDRNEFIRVVDFRLQTTNTNYWKESLSLVVSQRGSGSASLIVDVDLLEPWVQSRGSGEKCRPQKSTLIQSVYLHEQ